MLRKSKKGQFVIMSSAFLVLLLIFSYSLETQNSYIIKSSKNKLLNNIIYETCFLGKMSNGSQIDSRFSQLEIDIDSYCQGFGNVCNLNISKVDTAPSNLSLLNYTHYTYELNYSNSGYSFNSSFTC